MTNDLLLQIFTRSIPHLPKAATTFAQDLSKTVFGMITKPTSGLNSLRPLVSCYCSVVNNLTRDHESLGKLLFSCIAKTRKDIGAIARMNQAQYKGAAMVFYIVALIAEYGKLETVAQTDDKVRNIVDRISQRPLSEHLFDVFLEFAMASSSQHAPMLCLGALYRTNPRFIIHEKSTTWMRGIIESPNLDNQARVLQLLHDFLVSQATQSQPTKATKAKASDKGVSDLIGSGADLHQSSVSTALVQANIDFITKSAMSSHNALQAAAMEVFSFTVNQGLYHPGMLLPILVSLETSPSQRIARRALALHSSLHTKHASMLSVNYLHLARETFNYQKTITSEVVGDRNGEALLNGWYELLSEKRAWKIAFLQQLTKAFDYELLGDSPIEPEVALYIAENLAVLEYQAQEEVMVVIQQLSQVVRDGLGVANSIEEGKIMATMGTEPIADKAAIVSEMEQIPARRLANAATVVGLALLTKSLLLAEYGLTEDKCLKLVAGKKNPVGDKPATRKSPQPIPLDSTRLPYPRGVETVDEYFALQSAFLQLMREDGSLGLPV
ncbi:Sister chromatid cohesion protein 2 [Vanrija albida]|uniref:Sister chromatid cohesion protein n=1 Tax=Vanrija albida TaxID=181172 RepID=A0ABR3PSC7_9TREE